MAILLFGTLFISDVVTLLQKDHKLFSATCILRSKKSAINRWKIFPII